MVDFMYLKVLAPLAMVHMNEEILQMCDDILVLKMTVLPVETLNAMMLVVPARSSTPPQASSSWFSSATSDRLCISTKRSTRSIPQSRSLARKTPGRS